MTQTDSFRFVNMRQEKLVGKPGRLSVRSNRSKVESLGAHMVGTPGQVPDHGVGLIDKTLEDPRDGDRNILRISNEIAEIINLSLCYAILRCVDQKGVHRTLIKF